MIECLCLDYWYNLKNYEIRFFMEYGFVFSLNKKKLNYGRIELEWF